MDERTGAMSIRKIGRPYAAELKNPYKLVIIFLIPTRELMQGSRQGVIDSLCGHFQFNQMG
ncbi:MAG: hypothetical protein DMG64_19690, partial [Acidobacteria bacterium]